MSEKAKQLFDSLTAAKEALQAAPGLKTFMPELGNELSRLGRQGSLELASALFGNGAFVPYGPGQYTPAVEQQHEQDHEHEQGRGGRE